MRKPLMPRVFFTLTVLLTCACAVFMLVDAFVLQPRMLRAEDGVLDMRGYEADGVLALNGEWEFYYGQLLSDQDFINGQPPGRTLKQVPGNWIYYKDLPIDGDAFGCATYRLRILLPEENGGYGIKLPYSGMNARVLANGSQVLEIGYPSDSPETSVYAFEHGGAYIAAINGANGELELIIQVSSRIHVGAGITKPVYFGSEQAIRAMHQSGVIFDAALIFSLVFMALYFGGMSLQRRELRRAMLLFSLYCFVLAAYSSVQSEHLLLFFFPEIPPWTVLIKLKYLLVVAQFYLLIELTWNIFDLASPPGGKAWARVVALLFALLVIFTKFYVAKNIELLYIGCTAFVLMYLLHIIYRQARRDVEGKYYLYTAILCGGMFSVSHMLILIYQKNVFQLVFQTAFVLAIALYMSEKYNRMYQTITDLSERLLAADRLKDEFLASTSHELKTPLNGIINIAQSLMDGAGGALNAAQTENMRIITATGRRLSSLVYDLLDYARLRNQDIVIRPAVLDVHAVAAYITDIHTCFAEGKGLRILNLIPPHTHYVLADEQRFGQVLSNLLDNAVKFTPEGGEITLRCREEEGFAAVSVSDTGPGIPPGQLENIFLPYRQAADAAQPVGRGVGLG
ncbi:MAG TPA: sensor histidine kinase, partial [Feifaniaceae bacterium]|nr:sensor histidine kinase [Feifaniaceae bacterium]